MENKRGLILISFDYEFKPSAEAEKLAIMHNKKPDCINEETDFNLFEPDPDGNIVGFIESTYCSKYHPRWIHESKEYKKQQKIEKKKGNKRGRKPKPIIESKRKKNKGETNVQFSSCITFGVVSPTDLNRIHGIKLFRKTSGNIADLKYADDNEYIIALINKLLAYIEQYKPGSQLKYLSHKLELSNLSYKYILKDGMVINLFKLRELMTLAKYNNEYWECDKILVNFNGMSTHCKFIAKETDERFKKKNKKKGYKCCHFKINNRGNLYIYGSNDPDTNMKYRNKLFLMIEQNTKLLISPGLQVKDDPENLLSIPN